MIVHNQRIFSRGGEFNKPEYDTSQKEWEMQIIEYWFRWPSRKKLGGYRPWLHYKYYKTKEGAENALKSARRYGKYFFNGLIMIRRYRIVKRKELLLY